MNYIIFDLEFNSTKNYKKDIFLNEIIEIGAIKLDEKFNEIDTFSEVINPTVSKKLNKYVKTLTHISEDELKQAPKFKTIITQFIEWCGDNSKNIFLTWSDTDLHVLVENYNQLLNLKNVEFIEKYADLQKYLLSFIKTENNNQISLKGAAEKFEIDTSDFSLHRALDDSRVCATLLNKTFDKEKFSKYIRDVNNTDFYKRLMFKPYYITDVNSKYIDKNKFIFICPKCKVEAKKVSHTKEKNKALCTIYKCKNCGKTFAVAMRFKKTFDDLSINKSFKEIKQKKATEND